MAVQWTGRLVLALAFLLGSHGQLPAEIPAFTARVKSEKQLDVSLFRAGEKTEGVPLVHRQPNRERLYLSPTGWTWMTRSTKDFLRQPLLLESSKTKLILKGEIYQSVSNVDNRYVPADPARVGQMKHWNFSYDGAYSYALVKHNGEHRILFVRHNEHVNTRLGNNRYQGQIHPNVDVNLCASGFDERGNYTQCWESFSQFISLAWAPYDPVSGFDPNGPIYDLGPILWPSKAYRTAAGKRESSGFYLPTIFTHGDWIYVYFSNWNNGGSYAGISAARAPKSGFGAPGTWSNWTNGSFSGPSLPSGFSKDLIRDFYAFPGSPADPLFQDSASVKSHSIMFSVAKVRGTPFFIGLEERSPQLNRWEMGLRLSEDLVNWTPLTVLSSAHGAWGQGWYSYPTPVDRTASTTGAVDAKQFFILGKHATNNGASGYETSAMEVELTLPGYEPELTATPEEAMVRQYYRFFLGWNQMPVTDPGLQWHVANVLSEGGTQQTVRRFAATPEFKSQILNHTGTYCNRAYVTFLYRAIISREPDAAGLQYWIDQLEAQGKSRMNVLGRLLTSQEGQEVCRLFRPYTGGNTPVDCVAPPPAMTREERLVRNYYRWFLGWENPQADHVPWHVNNLVANNGACWPTIRNFAQSQAFIDGRKKAPKADFITYMYRALLGRNPESGAISWWQQYPQDQIIEGIASAPEGLDACAQGRQYTGSQ